MKTDTKSGTGLQRTARVLIKVILFLLLFIFVVFLLLLTPPVQRFLTGKVENFLENKLQTKVEIGRIGIGIPRTVVLEDIYFEDQTKDTLLSGERIKANINLLALLSNEVRIKDLGLENITAKVKRVLPDTAFNFQYIIDAFTVPASDTTTTTQMELDIDHVSLTNVRTIYKDVITGNDMFAHVGDMKMRIDTLNPYKPHFSIPELTVDGLTVRIYQSKPLVTYEPVAQDLAEAAAPSFMKLDLGTIDLKKVDIDYRNDVSAFYTDIDFTRLQLDGRQLDLEKQIIHLDKLQWDEAVAAITIGRKEAARAVKKEISQEVQVRKQQNWVVRVNELMLNNNTLVYDDNNRPVASYGMDYGHMRADSLTLHVRDFILNTDSIGGLISKGTFREKNGFYLEALEGEVLYAQNQSYLKNLYIKTPGTEIRRNIILEYASYDELFKNFANTVIDVELVNSRVQVKDILAFAPQLRTHPAFKNPGAIWQMHVVGSGTANRFTFDALQFNGLRNTQIDASGTIAGLNNPNSAGGTFHIRRLHTSQTDISLFTGQRLSNAQLNLPETFSASGTLSGNMASLRTNLQVSSSMGNVGVNGLFSNLTNPAGITYNANIHARSLRIGSIIRNNMIGAVSANVRVNGSGSTPETMNLAFGGTVHSIGYNKYNYRNIALDGTLRQNVFDVRTDINDPNIDLRATATGNLNNSSFRVNAFVDSIKTLPLGLTTQNFIFRGQIDADVASLTADYLDANVLVTKALFVSGADRLPIDTMQLVAGRNGTDQFIHLNSDIAKARIEGQYRVSELAAIIQNNIQPYFSLTSSTAAQNVRPYDFTFSADITNSPFISVFVPGLNVQEPIHAEGRLASGQGIEASVSTASVLFNENAIAGLDLRVNTTPEGLKITGNIAHLKSGTFDIYNTQLIATANNNIIDFSLDVNDKTQKDKYVVSGVVRQPVTGTYAITLKPEGLLLNYQPWTVSAGNVITISPDNISANDFVLQKDGQQLSLQTSGINSGPLNVAFTNFRIATITGFMQSDTMLVDGIMNGSVSFRNLMKQPLFTSDLTVTDLVFQQDTVGNVLLQVNSTADNRYLIQNATITGRGNDVQITGSLAPTANDIALDLNLAIRSLQLSTLEGALATAIRKADGTIDGNVKVGGTVASPDIDGVVNFNDASISTVFLGGLFRIDDEQLRISDDGFRFDNFVVRDSLNNELSLDGTVRTPNFINYYFDLNVFAKDFQVLNSTKKDNKLFYGKVVMSTDLHIDGTEKAPIIDGALSINKGTDLTVVIPQREPGVVQRQGIVEFVNMGMPEADTLFKAYDSLNYANRLVGMDIAANIEISKEANVNLVIDVANGDFINLRGEGLLTAGVDPSGKINLTGSYVLEEGSYQLSLNFLKRKFEIEPGSSIVWLGEPTRAQLDVTAVYIANAAPLDLVEDQLGASQAALRNYFLQKLPFEVYLKLSGELMQPIIAFDIALPPEGNYGVDPSVLDLVNVRLDQLRQEEGEVNKQVFSLLLMNRFIGENPFQSSGDGFSAGSFARGSVSRLMTEQLNSLAAGLIDGVDINFDVSSSDDYTTGERRSRTDLNVSLSKQLLNDRLTVSVGSNFELEGPQQSNQRSNNAFGDMSVNYKLSHDGRYMLRAYRRNQYEGVVQGYVIETGLGFSINVDYNKFSEIINRKKAQLEGLDDKQKPLE